MSVTSLVLVLSFCWEEGPHMDNMRLDLHNNYVLMMNYIEFPIKVYLHSVRAMHARPDKKA